MTEIEGNPAGWTAMSPEQMAGDAPDDVVAPEADRTPLVVAGGQRHAVVDKDGIVHNVILWDGATAYETHEDLRLVALGPDQPAHVGEPL